MSLPTGHIEISNDQQMELVILTVYMVDPETHKQVPIKLGLLPHYAVDVAGLLIANATGFLHPRREEL